MLVVAGGGLVALSAPGLRTSGAASPLTLSLSTTASGATCDNNANPSGPVCTGLASGDVVNVSGTGFTPGAAASIVECSSVATQPVIAPFPASCSLLNPTIIPGSGPNTGRLVGTYTIRTGTVGPPVSGGSVSCQSTSGWPTTALMTIPNCTTSGNAAIDAANYPCPPTAAQQLAGYICTVGIVDDADERVVGAALFGSETLPLCTSVVATTYPTFPCGSTSTTPSTSPTTTTTTTAATASTSTTRPNITATTRGPITAGGSGTSSPTSPVATASRTLAFTGPSAGVRWLMILGIALALLGCCMLVLVDAPRRALAKFAVRVWTNGDRRKMRADSLRSAWAHTVSGIRATAGWLLGR
jgi:hypothetical protein